ncbi:hypothetical protein BWZ22_15755 [Seonamhaeicola sp. S2-3]|uniref:DUF1801 domain-containing protein n=1 Tax=Seonamhaeicola sp. S2-3 TaxID=1936081 RepID=UPI000972D294|nr:DUF1801 domain-containing protein [Seonamhaeicola sp. S2-3]APY12585.1 hypothetical protein BWZ22_15755 [Seonamhaeicola sp. S2-3]
MKLKTNKKVATVFNNYPEHIKDKMHVLRALIIETAKETKTIDALEETLKWGEPSYITKHGSTLRIDWKPKTPKQYAMYFQCTSRLVSTFKSIFKNVFEFEGNRAIIFKLDKDINKEALKHCIKAALTYHKVKQFPTLGI